MTEQGTCAACERRVSLLARRRGRVVARHGSIYADPGAACAGSLTPPLEVSTEGASAAIGAAERRLAALEQASRLTRARQGPVRFAGKRVERGDAAYEWAVVRQMAALGEEMRLLRAQRARLLGMVREGEHAEGQEEGEENLG